ncbi:nucleotidyltransferase domain-containing protein [Candidatus Dojkabacteria bacterium]|nr:nucleotidyltransferase domain-containing protein [Candidatus Dojkabacteria bacterium]
MNIDEVKQKTKAIFEQYGILSAGVFGSIARGDYNDESDVDLMVTLGRPMGMFDYMRFIDSLEAVVKRKVDIVTDKSINQRVKPFILKDLTTIYERG